VNLVLSNPTGGAILGIRSSSSITIVDVNPDNTPPAVSEMSLSGPGSSVTAIVFTFSKEVNAATATNLNNYHLFDVGAGTMSGPGSHPLVMLRSATYNPKLHTVTLTPVSPLRANEWYYVDVKAAGAGSLADSAGNHLAGDGNGHVGTDYLGYFARGTNLRYADAKNHQVQMQITRGGVIDLTRYANGQGNEVHLNGIVPGKSVLTGVVRNGTTSFNSMTGLGAFGAVRISMATPPFFVAHYPFAGGLRPTVVGQAAARTAHQVRPLYGPFIAGRLALVRRA